jgi:pimeloyl-ACP methyl ester carboxylesterase
MGQYVQLGEVKTWYDEHGAGEPLVLMHGGLVDARFFEPNLASLAEHFHVYTPERRGHGHTPDVAGPISYQLMADDTVAFLETVVREPADLVGHSDGPFVAMLVAMQRPELVKRLVMISGGFNKSGEALPNSNGPDMEWDVEQITQFLGPAYGEVSPDGEGALPGRGQEDRRDGGRRAEPGHFGSCRCDPAFPGHVFRRRPGDVVARGRDV